MTKEELDALENEWKFQSSATSIHIYDLIVMAREALELREALEVAFSDKIALYKDGDGGYCCAVVRGERGRGKAFFGSTPLEAINNARRRMW